MSPGGGEGGGAVSTNLEVGFVLERARESLLESCYISGDSISVAGAQDETPHPMRSMNVVTACLNSLNSPGVE